ncbi:HNH endonuclease signature motif containing protein [Zhihengliuella salsuginis]|uniref:HNH nuclease domain-containing protein n=1 Tax=Zhihengliuella salsuginis TaxID=578222 RepID=A0ABQ3GNV7_9MICC|nr:HNH endonuclease signature motif containing protein [Zhihengliuella salsuginis]GHD13091.1 hypothetical protein GCM10008096_28950 [Zhihengliuella salsuginis]
MAIAPPFETPTPPAEPADRLRAAAELLAGTCDPVAGMTDTDLVEAVRAAEELGRLVDGFRVRVAGEVDQRSRRGLGEDPLSARHGCRAPAELLERLTQAPGPEVRRRAALDARTRTGSSLTGQTLPAAFPDVADALHAGAIGLETAELVTGMLSRIGGRADPADTAAAETALVAAATGGDTARPAGDGPDAAAETGSEGARELPAAADGAVRPTFAELKIQAQTWQAFLDQDGPAPDAERAARARGLTLGPVRGGLVPVRGHLMPETASQLTRLLDAHLNPAAQNSKTADSPDTAGEAGHPAPATGAVATEPGAAQATTPGTPVPVVLDERTPAQKRHDVLASILSAAARSTQTPTLGGDTATLLVHVNAEDLTDPAGIATLDGIDLPAPARIGHRIACTGAVQKIVFDHTGRVIGLGSKERVFTAHQRRAITARDGGCVIPGCTIPASWCEVHHVIEHADRGPTHTDNGVLLCWWHHHHLEQSGWQIRMNQAVPEVRAPAWADPSGGYRPAPNAITRRSRHHRPTPAPPENSGTSVGGRDPGRKTSHGPGSSTGGSTSEPWPWSLDPGRHPAADTSTRAEETSDGGRGDGGSGDATRRGETEDEFAARWDAAAARIKPETAEERRTAWSAPDDEPPWTDAPAPTTDSDD